MGGLADGADDGLDVFGDGGGRVSMSTEDEEREGGRSVKEKEEDLLMCKEGGKLGISAVASLVQKR